MATIIPAGATAGEVSFGPFRLLPAQFLLLEGSKPVPLGSRALHILIVLLERPGALVTKRELMARVWPNLFVSAANLSVHVSALRRLLRDGCDGNRFIINIPGRGYCFVAPIGGRAEGSCTFCREPIGASYLREVGTRNAYCSHECCLTQYEVVAPVPQEHEKAS